MEQVKRIDFHTHTVYSDGELTPYELLAEAKRIGIEQIAVTDHDNIGGIAEARNAAKELDICFVPGIEISTQELEEVHILGFGVDEKNEALCNQCNAFTESRSRRAELICGFLNRRNIPVTMEEIREIAEGETIGRPHFARYMEREGYVANCPEAFARYLNTPAFHAEVVREKPSPQEAIALIHQAGGKAVLAHPGLLKKNWYEVEVFIKTLKEAGLDGVECIYQKHSPATEKKFLELAMRYDLVTSCGSDYHGIHVKPDVPLGMKVDLDKYTGVRFIMDIL